MGKHYFLVNAAAQPAVTPPERWLVAFPDGEWCHWTSLQKALQAGDTVWVTVQLEDWAEKVAAMAKMQPDCHRIVMSLLPYDAEGLRAVNAGAHGYCHQLAVSDLLSEVAQAVGHGGFWLGPDLVQRMVAAMRDLLMRSPSTYSGKPNLAVLSDREAQVAKIVAEGKSNKEVADQLHISERTVKAHMGSVFEKLHVRDRVQLVLLMSNATTQSS